MKYKLEYKKEFLELLFSIKDETGKLLYQEIDIYDFKSLPKDAPLLLYTSFIYNQLSNKDERSKIEKEKFELFVLLDDKANAFAVSDKGYKIIGINLGRLNSMEKGVKECLLNLNSLMITPFIKENHLPDVESLIFRFTTFFTFFHELAHLIQFKNCNNNFNQRFERYNDNFKNTYSEVSHLKEVDADLFAAQMLSTFISQNWLLFPEQLKSILPIQNIVALGAASIFLLFFELINRAWPEIYFFDNTHPHPTIRISYIVDLMISLIIEQVKEETLSYEDVANYSFETSKQVINSEKRNVFKEYQTQYLNSRNYIVQYKKELSKARKKYPYLIQNFEC